MAALLNWINFHLSVQEKQREESADKQVYLNLETLSKTFLSLVDEETKLSRTYQVKNKKVCAYESNIAVWLIAAAGTFKAVPLFDERLGRNKHLCILVW